MTPLSTTQVEAIAEMLKAQKLSQHLYEELLDHFCCATEAEMASGKNFAEALSIASQQICPNGPQEIQFESESLTKQLKSNPMKKFMYMASFIAAVSLTTGALFKTLHWNGANILMLIGTILFVFALLPLIFYNAYQREHRAHLMLKLKVAFGYLGFALLAAGFLFKMLHWPTANVQIGLGIILLNLGYFPLVFLKMYRQSLSKADTR